MADNVKYNLPQFQKRGDYGIKVARSGFDVRTNNDFGLLFNSGWPLLQVVLCQKNPDYVKRNGWEFIGEKIGLGDRKYRQYRLYHGSGYPPLFMSNPSIRVDEDYIYCDIYEDGGDEFGMGMSVGSRADYVIVFNVNLLKDVDYPYGFGSISLDSGDEDYKILSAVRGNLGNRSEGYDLGIDMDILGMQVLAVKTQETSHQDNLSPGDMRIYYKFGVGYVPIVLCFFLDGNRWRQASVEAQAAGGYRFLKDGEYAGDNMRDVNGIMLRGVGDVKKMALVMLRMPMIAPTEIGGDV